MHALLATLALGSPAALAAYEQPPEDIQAILDAPYPPSVSFSPDGTWMVEQARPALRTLDELAAPRVKVAGIKLDPETFGPSRPYLYRGLVLRPSSGKGEPVDIELPDDARISNLRWHADGDKFSMTLTSPEGIALWLVTVPDGAARQLTPPVLNATYGNPCDWLPGDAGLVCKRVPAEHGDAPAESRIPDGPRIEQNLGRKTPARTYSNLLQSAHDEALFEHFLKSELVRVSLEGEQSPLLPAALVDEATPSPDGTWLLVHTIEPPFSYQVPVSRFPRKSVVFKLDDPGSQTVLAELPLADDVPVPFGSVRTGRRSIGWRPDLPATLYLVEALDGGDAGAEAEHRDLVSTWDAPFEGEPADLWRSTLRYSGMDWGDGGLALAWEWWYDTRQLRTWRIRPDDPSVAPKLVWDRSYQDAYSDPGAVVHHVGPHGRRVIQQTSDGHILLSGKGASPEGVYPFLDRMALESGETTRVWQASGETYESMQRVLDRDGTRFVTRRQSKTEPPNYILRKAGKRRGRPLTDFEDWAPQFAEVQKEKLHYERADGLPLTATLYLPPGYDKKKDGPLPTVFWAYPSEYKSKGDAGQNKKSEYTFSRPYGSSVLMMLLAGYAVVDDPQIPIVGEGDEEPNDTYVAQLVSGAEAAVQTVVGMGVADPDRLVIGGHSYGAFTTANLLAHTDLFRAGIARSGAYNRSLTPFGFQSEQRTYWEATDVYVEMSPFTHAAKIDEPMLMLHGAEDPNSGTYPMQSKRMYAAMKGNGGTVRWVELPYEEHGYRARESIGHALWEMIRWADTYAKEAGPREAPPAE
jgi:dipeptidyl aminopeptidase/acylaminoacyl peptidase